MHDDLISLSDRVWGWEDDYGQLARVGREAVLAHPGAYARGIARDFGRLLLWPLYAPLPEGEASAAAGTTVAHVQLPVPTEGEPIPAARESAYITTPRHTISEVWTSPTDHHIVFSRPRDEARAAEIDRRVDELYGGFPRRSARFGAVEWLNRASRWYPRPVVWLALGLLAAVVRRPRGLAVPLVLASSALLLLLATSLAVYAVPEYSVPVTPAFVLLAGAALFGSRTAPSEYARAGHA